MNKRQIQEICLGIQEMRDDRNTRSKNVFSVAEYLDKVWYRKKFNNNTHNTISIIASLKFDKVTTDKYDDKYF